MLTVGEILKLVIVERLFKLVGANCLRSHFFLGAMKAWQAARRWILKVS
jgi:hypothetical protein